MSNPSDTYQLMQGQVLHNQLYGINFSPFLGEQSPLWDSPQPTVSQIGRRLDLVAPFTNRIRVFNTVGICDTIIQIALEKGFEVVIGSWVGDKPLDNQASMEALLKWGKHPEIHTLLVGNEVLDRGDVPYSELVTLIDQVKHTFPEKEVSTALVIGTLEKYPDLIDHLDSVYVNLHPYFAGVAPAQAAAELQYQYRKVESLCDGKPIIISETGWPSLDGHEASNFLQDLLKWAKALHIPYYYFSAFDEPWKARTKGSFEAQFGLFNDSEQLKTGYQPIFYNDQLPIP